MKKTTAYCDNCKAETAGVTLQMKHSCADLCEACAKVPAVAALLAMEKDARDKAAKEEAERHARMGSTQWSQSTQGNALGHNGPNS